VCLDDRVDDREAEAGAALGAGAGQVGAREAVEDPLAGVRR
jgi:hypothetical protein